MPRKSKRTIRRREPERDPRGTERYPGILEVEFEMGDPAGDEDEGRADAQRAVGDGCAVGGAGEVDGRLLHQRGGSSSRLG